MANKEYALSVTYVSVDNGYLQIWGHTDTKACEIIEGSIALFDIAGGQPPELSSIVKGFICFAACKDCKVYRVRVEHVNHQLVTVFCIDYGFKFDVDYRMLRALPPNHQLITLPGSAVGFYVGNVSVTSELSKHALDKINNELYSQIVTARVIYDLGSSIRVAEFYKLGVDISLQWMINGWVLRTNGVDQQASLIKYLGLAPPYSEPMYLQRVSNHVPYRGSPQQMKTINDQSVLPTVQVPPARSYYYSVPIPVGQHLKAMVTDVNDGPWSFSVQLEMDTAKLDQVNGEMARAYKKPLDEIHVGKPCIVYSAAFSAYCRGIVVNFSPTQVKVELVDYGSVETCSMKEISQLPPSGFDCKMLSQRFTLTRLTTLNPETKAEVSALFTEIVKNKEVLLQIAPKEENCIQSCDVFIKQLNVKEIMNRKMKEKKVAYVPEPFPPVGSKNVCFISHVDSPSRFYVQLHERENDIGSLQADLQECSKKSAVILEDDLKLRLPCLTMFPDDGQWYRSRVSGVTEESVTVFFVDYGNSATIEKHNVKNLTKPFISSLKTQALMCTLKTNNPALLAKLVELTDNLVEVTILAVDNNLATVRVEFEGKDIENLALWSPPVPEPEPVKPVTQSDGWNDSKPISPGRNNESRGFNDDNGPKRRFNDESGGGFKNRNGDSNFNNGDGRDFKERDGDSGFKKRFNDDNDGGFKGRNRDNDSGLSWRNRDDDSGFKSRNRDDDSGFRSRNRDDDGGFKSRNRDDDSGFRSRNRDDDGGFKSRNRDDDSGFRSRNRDDDGGFKSRNRDDDGGFKSRNRDDDSGFKGKFGVKEDDGGFKGKFGGRGDDGNTDTRPKRFPIRNEDRASPGSAFNTPTLENGSVQEVAIPFLVSPHDFYVQLQTDKDAFKTLMEGIQTDYADKFFYREDQIPSEGEVVIAKFFQDRVLYRAEIVSNSPILVRFVDYGNTADIRNFRDVYPLMEKYLDFPAQAVRCSLLGVKPNGEVWSDPSEYFDRPLFSCTFHEEKDGIFQVSLSCNEKDLAEELIAAGLALPDKQASVLEVEETEILSIDYSLLPGQILALSVTYVESVDKFFAHILPSVDFMQTLVAEHMAKSKVVMEAAAVVPGALCISHLDDTFYRGKVIEITEGLVYIQFIDFGDGVEHPLSEIFTIPEEASKWSPLAMEFGLYGDTSLVTDDDQDLFKSTYEAATLLLKVHSAEDERCIVTAYDAEGKKVSVLEGINDSPAECSIPDLPIMSNVLPVSVLDFCSSSQVVIKIPGTEPYQLEVEESSEQVSVGSICAALCEDGIWRRATRVSETEVYLVDEGRTAPSTNVRPLPVAWRATPCAVRKVKTVWPMLGDNTVIVRREEDEIVIEPKTKLFYISFVESATDFYINLDSISPKLDEIQAEIATTEPAEVPEDVTMVLAKYPDDEQWYRASVLSRDPIKVQFIDYGNEAEVTEIAPMPDKLSTIPPLSKKINLAVDLPPEAKEKLEGMIEQAVAPLVLVEEEGKFVDMLLDGRSLVSLLLGKTIVKQGATVYVSFVVNHSEFYIQQDEDSAKLENLANKLVGFDSFPVVAEPQPGVIYAGKYTEDDAWYRARIENDQVYFIDHGNCAEIAEIRELPADLAEDLPMAVKVALDLEDDQKTETVDNVLFECLDGRPLTITKLNTRDGVTYVNLADNGEDILTLITSTETSQPETGEVGEAIPPTQEDRPEPRPTADQTDDDKSAAIPRSIDRNATDEQKEGQQGKSDDEKGQKEVLATVGTSTADGESSQSAIAEIVTDIIANFGDNSSPDAQEIVQNALDANNHEIVDENENELESVVSEIDADNQEVVQNELGSVDSEIVSGTESVETEIKTQELEQEVSIELAATADTPESECEDQVVNTQTTDEIVSTSNTEPHKTESNCEEQIVSTSEDSEIVLEDGENAATVSVIESSPESVCQDLDVNTQTTEEIVSTSSTEPHKTDSKIESNCEETVVSTSEDSEIVLKDDENASVGVTENSEESKVMDSTSQPIASPDAEDEAGKCVLELTEKVDSEVPLEDKDSSVEKDDSLDSGTSTQKVEEKVSDSSAETAFSSVESPPVSDDSPSFAIDSSPEAPIQVSPAEYLDDTVTASEESDADNSVAGNTTPSRLSGGKAHYNDKIVPGSISRGIHLSPKK